MYYVIDKNIDPWWNLAAEEYLFKQLSVPIFRLWQNNNAIIIGHHQNAFAEINTEYVRSNGIKVVRRLTGGGAVFHDLGNINFTFIDNVTVSEDTSSMFARFTKPIIEALRELGVNAYLEGRNDLLIDGKKFSGNAVARYKNRLLQHGTLLFSASMADLSNALSPDRRNLQANLYSQTEAGSPIFPSTLKSRCQLRISLNIFIILLPERGPDTVSINIQRRI